MRQVADGVKEIVDGVTLVRLASAGFHIIHASEIVCSTHDLLPATEEEEDAMEMGGDPCIFAVRIWPEDV